MEAYIRRTGAVGSQQSETYEFSYLLDLRHLAAFAKNYLAVYGEELTDEKLNVLIIDLIYGLMTDLRFSQSHRWIRKFFQEGAEFIEHFEKETAIALSSVIPNWRDFEPECIHILIEQHISCTFIGFKPMLPNVNHTLLPTHNGMDTYIAQNVQALFEQEVILDFSNSMAHEVCEQELISMANGRLTWAFLIEECLRVNADITKRGFHPIQMVAENIIEFLDVDELRARYENSPIMNRCLLVDDISVAEATFDNIIIDLAGLIARILYSNSEILTVIHSQLFQRLNASGHQGLVAFHCVGFQWMNRAGIAKFGAYRIA